MTAEQGLKHTPTSPIDVGSTFGAALPLRSQGAETALYNKIPSQNHSRPIGMVSLFPFAVQTSLIPTLTRLTSLSRQHKLPSCNTTPQCLHTRTLYPPAESCKCLIKQPHINNRNRELDRVCRPPQWMGSCFKRADGQLLPTLAISAPVHTTIRR